MFSDSMYLVYANYTGNLYVSIIINVYVLLQNSLTFNYRISYVKAI